MPSWSCCPSNSFSGSCSECAKANGKRHYTNNRDAYIKRATDRIAATRRHSTKRAATEEATIRAFTRQRQEEARKYGQQLAIYQQLWRLANPDRSGLTPGPRRRNVSQTSGLWRKLYARRVAQPFRSAARTMRRVLRQTCEASADHIQPHRSRRTVRFAIFSFFARLATKKGSLDPIQARQTTRTPSLAAS